MYLEHQQEPSPPTFPPHEDLELLLTPTATSPIRLLYLEHLQEPSPSTFPLRVDESTWSSSMRLQP